MPARDPHVAMAPASAIQARRLTAPLFVDGFLKPRTCARMLAELDHAFWQPSTVVNRTADGDVVARRSAMRISQSAKETLFPPAAGRIAVQTRERVGRMLRVSASRFEEWQAVRYRCGGKFDYHLDAGLWSSEPAGERVWTVMVYLDTPLAGGATTFKELGLEVQAIAGRLLIWKNLLSDGTPNPWMLHRGAPVRRGRKTILVTWIRERAARP